MKPLLYPEHEKMHAIKEQSQTIGEFLDWLSGERIVLCDFNRDELTPIYQSIEKLLAEYFNIDLEKIEEEKQKMLEEIRKSNEFPNLK